MPRGRDRNSGKLSTACGESGGCAFRLPAEPEPFAGAAGTPVAPVAVL